MSRAFLFKFMDDRAEPPQLKKAVSLIVRESGFKFVRPPIWVNGHYSSYIDTKRSADPEAARRRLLKHLTDNAIGAELSCTKHQVIR